MIQVCKIESFLCRMGMCYIAFLIKLEKKWKKKVFGPIFLQGEDDPLQLALTNKVIERFWKFCPSFSFVSLGCRMDNSTFDRENRSNVLKNPTRSSHAHPISETLPSKCTTKTEKRRTQTIWRKRRWVEGNNNRRWVKKEIQNLMTTSFFPNSPSFFDRVKFGVLLQ